MALQLPFIPSEPNYRFGTTLDGAHFIFDVHWNGRDGAWYFDMLTANETIIVMGVKVVLGAILRNRSNDPNLPVGVLVAGDLSGSGVDAGLDDLGIRVMVYFYTAAEYAAL